MQELNLTTGQSLLLLISLIAMLVFLLRHKSYVSIDLEQEEQEPKNNRDLIVGCRYGRVIQSQGHYYN